MSLRVKAQGTGHQGASAPGAGGGPRRIPQGTAQQEALWAELAEDTAHVLVEARAGSGKSSSSREGMWRMLGRRPGLKVRYLVFNKANADEFRRDCPPGVDVGTIHSAGYQALRQACGSEIDKNKTYLLLDEDRKGRSLKRFFRKSIAQLVSLAKNHNLPVPPDERERPSEFAFYAAELADLMTHYQVKDYHCPGLICDWATRVLRHSARAAEVIDFDDMVWLPQILGLQFPAADVTFADECQDLNAAQHALLPLIAGGGRVVAVGDRFQAIYAFRGADSESIPKLEAALSASARGLARLPLTITFRCPKSHVALANAYVADLEAHPSNADGLVVRGNLDLLLADALPGDMVICPTNAPAVSVALQLLARKRRAVVRGRAVGDQLLALFRGIGPGESVAGLRRELQTWKANELARLEELDGVEDVVAGVHDRAAGLDVVLSACDGPGEVEPLIADLFTEQGVQAGAVTFSTVHRAKGLEAPRVWYLQAPPRAPRAAWEAQQQRNLAYVALTRSKDTLVFVDP